MAVIGPLIDWWSMADLRSIITSTIGLTDCADLSARVAELKETAGLRRCFQFFENSKKWIDEQHLSICRVPALTFRERARAQFISEIWRDLGLRPSLDEAGNLVAPIVYSRDLPFVAVSAHLDTILAPRSDADIRVGPDGTFYGPGVTDNGVGLAGLTALARALQGGPLVVAPRRNILLVANVAEEGEGNLQGMKYLCLHSPFAPSISEYLVIDGSSLSHITSEALGSRRFELVIEGRGGHSWNDFGMANPVHAMSRACSLLSDIELPTSPPATLTVAMIEGGNGVNSIATGARAKVDIRSRSAEAIDLVVGRMEAALKQAVDIENRRATQQRLTAFRIREIGHRPAAPATAENPLVDCIQAVDSNLRIRSRVDCASTDANVPLAAGYPAVAIGAGGRGGDPHAPTEWYRSEGRALGLQRIALTLALLQTSV